jgi:hypothetical protein
MGYLAKHMHSTAAFMNASGTSEWILPGTPFLVSIAEIIDESSTYKMVLVLKVFEIYWPQIR